ncbi:MAG: carbamoyltransferase [Proteobacteria bacterium]|nr:carbamoyltransferase [Pseudomonadota bacterium]MBU1715981.1 carbamoyltransferase [Pseudomonadota bacterium]
MPLSILGISAFYHDSGAVLLQDGEIVAAAQEERFTRIKHDQSFPNQAITYVLNEAGLSVEELDSIVFYDKPLLKFERLLETYHSFAPTGLRSFLSAIPVWIKEKIFMKKLIWDELERIGDGKLGKKPPLLFPEHHFSHAASAFYPSPFEEAAILTIDGVGEWTTTSIGHGKDREISFLRELNFPHSIGLLYSAFTYYLGFKVNSGEYKLMGLAPYGNKAGESLQVYKRLIFEKLVDLRDDGSLVLNMEYFDYATNLKMCHDRKWHELFGFPKREAEAEISQHHMDLALAIQEVTEEVVFRLARTARQLTDCRNLVMAGGVALNCVANGKLLREKIFDDIWIQPAAGDAGGALGAAFAAYHLWHKQSRLLNDDQSDKMQGCYLGPEFSDVDIKRICRKYRTDYHQFEDSQQLAAKVSELLADGKVVGWFQGRMEWGPRALGNRSILGDPRNPEMQKRLNLKIKKREGFRPFAPSVLEEDVGDYFDLADQSPYMLLVASVIERRRKKLPANYDDIDMYDRLYQLRSDIPAVTHVDFSARVQTVSKQTNPIYWHLINEFKKITGCSLLVNTSFNVRGEPIVCTPDDAYQCFFNTDMDYLVMGSFLISKET